MAVRNLYATVDAIKTWLSISVATYDDTLESLLDAASRKIDDETARYFCTRTATLYADTAGADMLILPQDLISMTTLTTDTEGDGTYDGETWTENTDFWLWPAEAYPKLQIHTTAFGSYSFAADQRRDVKMVGTWGYGDETSDPWLETSVSATVTDGTTESVSLDTADIVERGHTLKVGDEQMFVTADTAEDSALTTAVARGVNGTTAAATASGGDTVYLAQYPARIVQACKVLAARFWAEVGDEVLKSERIGDYSYSRFAAAELRRYELGLVDAYRRPTAV
jgi:hypothetical protein